jgi:hypothetical protein
VPLLGKRARRSALERVDRWQLLGKQWVGPILLPSLDVIGVTVRAEVDDPDPDHRELGPTRLLEMARGTELISLLPHSGQSGVVGRSQA